MRQRINHISRLLLVVRITGVVAILVVLACNSRKLPTDRFLPLVTNPTTASDPDRPCDIQVHEDVTLSPGSQCVVNLYKKRCNENDVCMVDCMVNAKDQYKAPAGESAEIGGGCFHVCFAYTGIEWTTPEGFKECADLKDVVSYVDPGTLPKTFFEGRVCEGDDRFVPLSEAVPCDKPIKGAMVTIENSHGQTVSTETNAQGFYSLPVMPLYGTEDDVVTYAVDGFVTQRASHVLYDVATMGNDAGALVFLMRLLRYS